MATENYKIAPNYYTTNALTYILFGDVVIDFVESMNYQIIPNDDPTKVKIKKTKRNAQTISAECERKINKHINEQA